MSLLRALKSQPPAPPIENPAEVDRLYSYWRIRLMYSMMTGYAVFYFVRKNFSMANNAFSQEFGFTNTEVGLILSVSTIVYAFWKFFSGVLADIANPRYLMAGGLIVSALVNIAFGFSSALWVFVALWALNSVFQGMGMPPCSKILNSWFSRSESGRAWGIWNASHQIGGAIIVILAGFLVDHYGWRSAFIGPALFALVIGFFLLNRLRDTPVSLGLPPVNDYKKEPALQKKPEELAGWPAFTAFILKNRILWIVCIANVFVYIVRTGIFDWGAKFLIKTRGYSATEAGVVVWSFEIAGIFGAFLAGWLTDRLFVGRRGAVCAIFMLFLALSVAASLAVPETSFWLMVAVMAAIGFFVYGPQVLVAVVAAENTDPRAVGTAVGMTGLFGYAGATVCGVGTGILADKFGWNAAFYMYAASAVIGSLLFLFAWKPVKRHH
jgi:phosphoglycerate transporter family protein